MRALSLKSISCCKVTNFHRDLMLLISKNDRWIFKSK